VSDPRRLVPAILQSRLAQFAFFGGLLFLIAPRPQSANTIEITSERLAALRAADAARPGARSLALDHASEIDQREIEDELLYREGIRLGLDKNDGIVRQRIVQKVLFLAEEVAGASRPADEVGLRAFFEQNKARWAIGESLRFEQIFRHSPSQLDAWAAGQEPRDPPTGEASPVAPKMDETRERIAAQLGAGFADAVAAAPVGKWSGPVRSTFGWHLVRLEERRPGRPARLEEVRPSVVEAYGVFRRQEAIAAFLETAFARYKVAIDGKPMAHFTPSRRVAFRSVSSGED
jgi:hypothetical protein